MKKRTLKFPDEVVEEFSGLPKVHALTFAFSPTLRSNLRQDYGIFPNFRPPETRYRKEDGKKMRISRESDRMISHRLIRNLPRISAIRTFSRTAQRLEEKQTGKSEDPDDFGQIFDTISTTTKKDVQDMSFAKMLRNSKLMQLGGIEGRLVVGRIVDRVVDDLYIDFGFKFNAVCKTPAVNGEAYCIGSHVLLRLHDLELSERFLGSKSDLTLLEADATLVRLLQRRNKEGTTGREQAKATEHTGTEKAGKEQEQVVQEAKVSS